MPYIDNLRILARKEITERRNDALLDQSKDLFAVATDGKVANCPSGLLLCLELALAQVLDDLGQKINVDDCLYLRLVAGGDVGQEPDSFLAYLFLRVREQGREVGERIIVKHHLRLLIGSGYNIANGTQRSSLHFDFIISK